MLVLARAAWIALTLTACAAPPVSIEADDTASSASAEEIKTPAPAADVRGRITDVIDGDTLQARIRGTTTTVRLIGLDAPELPHPPDPAECFAAEAAGFAQTRVEGRRVTMQYDAERIDAYGRTLVYVWIGKRLFNEDILSKGYATVATIPPNVAQVQRLVEAERQARRDGIGLWDTCLHEIDTGADWRELGTYG